MNPLGWIRDIFNVSSLRKRTVSSYGVLTKEFERLISYIEKHKKLAKEIPGAEKLLSLDIDKLDIGKIDQDLIDKAKKIVKILEGKIAELDDSRDELIERIEQFKKEQDEETERVLNGLKQRLEKFIKNLKEYFLDVQRLAKLMAKLEKDLEDIKIRIQAVEEKIKECEERLREKKEIAREIEQNEAQIASIDAEINNGKRTNEVTDIFAEAFMQILEKRGIRVSVSRQEVQISVVEFARGNSELMASGGDWQSACAQQCMSKALPDLTPEQRQDVISDLDLNDQYKQKLEQLGELGKELGQLTQKKKKLEEENKRLSESNPNLAEEISQLEKQLKEDKERLGNLVKERDAIQQKIDEAQEVQKEPLGKKPDVPGPPGPGV